MAPPPRPTSPAKDNRIEKLKKKVNKWIDDNRYSHPLAAANLQHWRDGHGVTKVMSSASFLSQSFFLDHLRDVHRAKFVNGVRARLAGGVLKPGDPVELWYEDSVAASMWFSTDLFYALGGFTVHSEVSVDTKLTNNGSALEISFAAWNVVICDEYNWDKGKKTAVGFDVITDEEMLSLEQVGFGRSFKITSDCAKVTDSKVTAPETIQLNSIAAAPYDPPADKPKCPCLKR